MFKCDFFLERPSFRGIWRKYHITMYFFWERSSFIFRPGNKIIFSGKRNIIFPDNTTKKIIFQCDFFGKPIFSEHLKKISYFHVLFWERSSSIFRLKTKMIFSGKGNIIFPDNTRKIIFQRNFFGNTIFSVHLEKKIWFFVQCIFY